MAEISLMEFRETHMLREISQVTESIDKNNQERGRKTGRFSYKLSKLKVLYTNANGIKGKVTELQKSSYI